MNRKQVYSVSSVNQYIKSLFMDDFALNHIYVRGEISNCKYHSSGHIYFTLKDRGGAIACVMFVGNRKGLNFRMSEGMAVIVYGSVSVYERDGKYQLYAREIIQEGAGRLYEAYEALKKKLLAEGLFDEEHKQKIPKYPKRLGVVTARTGAAVQDIINVSLRRNPWLQIVFCPSAVQGDGAAQSVVRGIHALEAAGVDVILGQIQGYEESLSHAMEQAVLRNRQRVENYQRIFRHLNPQSRLNDRRQRLMEIEERLRIGMNRKLDAAKSELAIRTQKLEGVSPLRQLERGYAYVSDEEGHGITSAGQVTKGQRLLLDVRDGRIESEVTAVKKRMS